MKHKAYLRKAHADALAGLNDAQTTDVLLGVYPMARCGTVWNDNPHVVPMPQNMNIDADPSGNLTDLQRRAPFRLDLR